MGGKRAGVILTGLLVLCPAVGAGAQVGERQEERVGPVRTEPMLESGARIRIETEGRDRALIGSLLTLRPDVLRLRTPGRDSLELILPLEQVTKLEVSTAPPNRGKGFLVGAGIGAGVSLLGGVLLQMMPTGGGGANLAIAGGVVMAVPLGLLGGVFGALVAQDQWTPVRIITENGRSP